MKKALRDYFYIETDGVIKLYNEKESTALIEAANLHIDSTRSSKSFGIKPEFEAFIFACLDSYYQNGVTEAMLSELNGLISNVYVQCMVEKKSNKLITIDLAHFPRNSKPTIFAAYMFSNIMSFGGFENLKRCQYSGCTKFFIGRPNSKWCSKGCGTSFRVKKFRKKRGSVFP